MRYKRASNLVRGDIIALGTSDAEDFTVMGVETVQEGHIRVDIGDGNVYFHPDEMVDVIASAEGR